MTQGFPVDSGPARLEFKDFERLTCAVPQEGSDRLYVGRNLPKGLYWVGSDSIMPGSTASTDGELKRVRLARSGYAYFDEPFRREWHGPAVIPLNAPILPEVKLSGGSGPLSVCLAENVLIENWTIPDGWEGARALSIQSCRRIAVRGLQVGRSALSGPGQGYGLQVQRCTDFLLEDLAFTGCRHGVTPFACSYGTVRNSRLVECGGEDGGHYAVTHLRWENCNSGGKEMAVGNRWPYGCEVEIVGHEGTNLIVYGNCKAKVKESNFSGYLRGYANEAGNEMEVETDWQSFGGRHRQEPGARFRLVVE